jgi:glycosyltransferase involved in cell wall biosynthesis
MKCEVIVSTYENPRALHLCLVALYAQSHGDFNVCIADDGSGLKTKELVEQWQHRLGGSSLRHVWQTHNGFGKNKILNRAIAESTADYLIFIDGDCVSSPRFIERHKSLSRPGRFLTGGVIRLSESVSSHLEEANITSGDLFNPTWLSSVGGLSRIRDRMKLGQFPQSLNNFMEIITPVKRTWNGGNASGWRQDLLTVNGFDESLSYGAEDIELGFRLNNIGVKGRRLRYSAPLLHLEHSRNYIDTSQFAANRARVFQLRNSSVKWTNEGILKKSA